LEQLPNEIRAYCGKSFGSRDLYSHDKPVSRKLYFAVQQIGSFVINSNSLKSLQVFKILFAVAHEVCHKNLNLSREYKLIESECEVKFR